MSGDVEIETESDIMSAVVARVGMDCVQAALAVIAVIAVIVYYKYW